MRFRSPGLYIISSTNLLTLLFNTNKRHSLPFKTRLLSNQNMATIVTKAPQAESKPTPVTKRSHAGSKKPRQVKPWSVQTAPANERYVAIALTTTDGKSIEIHKSFSLSLLLLYSKRAQNELPKLGEGQGKLTWSLGSPDDTVDSRGFINVLTFLRNHVEGRGYPITYKGHVKIQHDQLTYQDMDACVRTLLAMEYLQLAAPLDGQYALTNATSAFMQTEAFGMAHLLPLISLAGTTNHTLFTKAIHWAVDRYDENNEDSSATWEEYHDFVAVREANEKLHDAMVEVEVKKEKRMAREYRNEQHRAYLEREARRQAKKEKDAKYQDLRTRVALAADGEHVLKPHEVDAVMGRR